MPKHAYTRHFSTYTGLMLPLRLVQPLEEGEVRHRNTYFRAYYDGDDRLLGCDKVVYGEVELTHRYDYYPSGTLRRAEITEAGDAPRDLVFDDVVT